MSIQGAARKIKNKLFKHSFKSYNQHNTQQDL